MAEKELAASLFSKLVQMLAAIHEPIEEIISVWEKWLRITSQKFDKEKKSWEFVWMADIRHPGTPRIGIGLEVVLKGDTVDGRNPAPVDLLNIALFTGFHTSQVVQEFFHQQYHESSTWQWEELSNDLWRNHPVLILVSSESPGYNCVDVDFDYP